MSLTESTPTTEAVPDPPMEDSDFLADVLEDIGTDLDATTTEDSHEVGAVPDPPMEDSFDSTTTEDSHEVSFVFKSNPKKIKLDCRLLSGFCMESSVPLEDGLNVETFGVVVGKRVGKEILSTHIIITIDRDLERVTNWILHDFKPFGSKTEIVGIICSHIGDDSFGLSSSEVQLYR